MLVKKIAPICLFVYDRLDHTRQTVEALKQNFLAQESDLVIYSDAAKSKYNFHKVEGVRQYIREIEGFKSICIVEREMNFGLAKSIIDGVTKIVNNSGRVLVLEDDIVTSPYFLKFMNEALIYYQNDEKIISVTGHVFPMEGELPETFFLRDPGCWGWATWKSSWELFEPDGRKLLLQIKRKKLESEFNFEGSYNYIKMLKSQIARKNDSWAVRWYASAFINNKLTLYPGRSLVQNIGNDGSGTHGGNSQRLYGFVSNTPIKINEIDVKENIYVRSILIDYLINIRDGRLLILYRKILMLFK